MPCYHPQDVTIRRLPFRPGARRTSDRITVGCGKCLGCRARQARDWAIRLFHHAQTEFPAWFITLTYSNDQLPDWGNLHGPDLQFFVRNLRVRFPDRRLSYYIAGEYGETTQRPHYHAVCYGFPLPDRVPNPADPSGKHWGSRIVEMAWSNDKGPLGHVDIAPLTWETAFYVAGYVQKKLSKTDHPEQNTVVDPTTGELFQRKQEFARMSLKPAIALRWLSKNWSDIYPRGHVTIRGHQVPIPRYYDRAFGEFTDAKMRRLLGHTFKGITHLERQEMLYGVKMKRLEYDDLEPLELEAKEIRHKARIRNKLRSKV